MSKEEKKPVVFYAPFLSKAQKVGVMYSYDRASVTDPAHMKKLAQSNDVEAEKEETGFKDKVVQTPLKAESKK